jgi:hypothetical protein
LRLWSLHPRYLDPQGLVALWREALLARAVLQGRTRGYRHHPQLLRFQAHAMPRVAICAYLGAVHDEARQRGYAFDPRKVGPRRPVDRVPVTRDQIAYEWEHLLHKLSRRNPQVYRRWRSVQRPDPHPLMRTRAGAIEPWEKKKGRV